MTTASKNAGAITPEVNAPNSIAPNSTQAASAPVTSSVLQPGTGQTDTGRADDGAALAKKKKTDCCFRCKQPGHYIDDCTVPMCDICESVNHATTASHLLHAPKPTVAMYGYANEALMFFEVPFRGTYKPKV
jgi:hypothetical protein